MAAKLPRMGRISDPTRLPSVEVVVVAVNYAHSLRTTPQPPSQSDFSDFKNSYELAENSFELPGLGSEGPDCGAKILTKVSNDPKNPAVKFERMRCRRVECPTCWKDWARRRVFDMVLKIEAYAKAEGKRPFFCVASVPPNEARAWNWDRLNTSLFRRFYRRGKKSGIGGGFSIFHPFRIKIPERYVSNSKFCLNHDCFECPFRKDCVKYNLYKAGYGSPNRKDSAGYWEGVRDNALGLDSWRDYVRFSPHLHSIVFGDPKEHRGDDFVIRVKDNDYGEPVKMDLDSVLSYCYYLITHTGVGSDFQTKVTRSFGCLYGVKPEELLSDEEFNDLASKIAEKLGMNWENEELAYPVEEKNDSSHVDKYEWISIWKLNDKLDNEKWVSSLSDSQEAFFQDLASYLSITHKPPPYDSYENLKANPNWLSRLAVWKSEIGREKWKNEAPGSVAVFVEREPKNLTALSKPSSECSEPDIEVVDGELEDYDGEGFGDLVDEHSRKISGKSEDKHFTENGGTSYGNSHLCDPCAEFGIEKEAVKKVLMNGRDRWLCDKCLKEAGFDA